MSSAIDGLSIRVPAGGASMPGKLFALALVATVAGCATPGITVTVTSSPDGAYITTGGAVSGIVPVVVFWERQRLESRLFPRDTNGCLKLPGFTARWASGAVTEVPVLQHCGELDGNYTFNMSRNMNAPDFDKDMQFALQVQAVRAQRAQAVASESAALAALWSASTAAQKAQRPVQCSSYTSGSTIQTRCQ